MGITGFSYVRNGFNYGVPFLQSIQSILPICEEFIIAVGDSTDGTREAIMALDNDKIKIIDTIWDMGNRIGGKVFAQQANIALDQVKTKWAFHIQADEVIHEKDHSKIINAIQQEEKNEKLDGFIFPFLHFWGDYQHIRSSRRMHRFEIRLFKNEKLVRSYRDSQGFRWYNSLGGYEKGTDPGMKLKVKIINAPIFHYTGVRDDNQMKDKVANFMFLYGGNNPADEKEVAPFNYHEVDRVRLFQQTHPSLMAEKIQAYRYKFEHDTSQAKWRLKDKLLQPIEDLIHYRFGEYKNYKLIK